MEVDAGTAGAARGRGDRYVDGSADWAQELPEDCSGYVTQYGPITAGEHSRHEAPVEAQAAVADGVDASVDVMHAARGLAFRDRWPPKTHRRELLSGDDSMLPIRNLSDGRVGRVEFVRHIRTKSTGASISPPYSLLCASRARAQL